MFCMLSALTHGSLSHTHEIVHGNHETAPRSRLADFDISVDLQTRVSVRYAKNRTTLVGYTPGFEVRKSPFPTQVRALHGVSTPVRQ